MVQRKQQTLKKIIGMTVIFIAVALLFGQQNFAYAAERSLIEVDFQYVLSEDETSFVPQANIRSTSFNNGLPTLQVFKYPEKSLKIPASAAKNYLFRASFKDPYLINSNAENKAYVIGETTLRPKGSLKASTVRHYMVYELDLTNGKLRVLNDVEVKNVSEKENPAIYIHPNVGVYEIQRQPNEQQRYAKRTNEIFLLKDNKRLISNASRDQGKEIEQDGQAYLQIEDYTLFKEITGKARPDGSYITTAQGTYRGITSYITQNGKHIKALPASNSRSVSGKSWGWEKKIGTRTYVHYTDPKSKRTAVGYLENGKIKPLSPTGSQSRIEFSSHNTYMVIREFPRLLSNGKTNYRYSNLLVVDLRTAKVAYTIKDVLSGAPDWLLHDVHGDIVTIHCNDYRYNSELHLPTGTLIKALPNSKNRSSNSTLINFKSSEDLLSRKPSPATYVNGKAITFSGQGPFMTSDNRWYMEAEDFAKAVGGQLTLAANKNIVIKRGDKQLTVSKSDKETIFHAGKTYIPLERLNESLGVVAAFMDDELTPDQYRYDVLRLFTEDMTESQAAADPSEFEFIEDFDLFNKYYYEVVNGKPEAKKTTGMQGYYSGGTMLMFKDGQLKNAYGALSSRTLRNINFDLERVADVVKAYGSPKKGKNQAYTLRWYEMKNHFLVFECEGNLLHRVAYVSKS